MGLELSGSNVITKQRNEMKEEQKRIKTKAKKKKKKNWGERYY